MEKKLLIKLVSAILLVLFASICGCNVQQGKTNGKLNVFVTIPPQVYFVEKIGGNYVDVSYIVPPGSNPSTYEIKPNQLLAIREATLYIKIGHLAFEEAWLSKITNLNRSLKIVDSSKGINIVDNDPHFWLAPPLVCIQAKNILEALVEVDPVNKDYYENRYDKFIKELNEADRSIRSMLLSCKKHKFIVYHPAWGYFAREYGLEQIAIEHNGKEPSVQDMVNLVGLAKKEGIKTIFVAVQHNPAPAQAIAGELGGSVVIIDPLSKDYIENIMSVTRKISKALE